MSYDIFAAQPSISLIQVWCADAWGSESQTLPVLRSTGRVVIVLPAWSTFHEKSECVELHSIPEKEWVEEIGTRVTLSEDTTADAMLWWVAQLLWPSITFPEQNTIFLKNY